jgi:RHS repeat-associated protein
VQRFVWDGDQLLYEVRARGDSAAYSYGVEDDLLDGTGIYGALKAYGRVGYTHAGGIDRPLGAVRGTTPFYPHTNSRGLYEAATVDNGTVLTNDVAWPGQSASAYLGWTPRATPYQWFGSLVTEQADASGLLYRRNRYYDPKVGRFTQPDPIGIAGGLNSYGFAGGDPVNYSDPFGLCKNAKGEEVPCPDKNKVVQWMRQNAHEASRGQCARYCRLGLEAAGFDSSGRPASAGDYGPFLKSRGAGEVSKTDYAPQMGDIVVFGKNEAHPHGHMAVFDGDQWISDFKQKKMNPYRDEASAGEHTIYRFPDN